MKVPPPLLACPEPHLWPCVVRCWLCWKVDNRVVGQTGWGPVAKQSWDQTLLLPWERVRLPLCGLG